jgi:hypothetical protein
MVSARSPDSKYIYVIWNCFGGEQISSQNPLCRSDIISQFRRPEANTQETRNSETGRAHILRWPTLDRALIKARTEASRAADEPADTMPCRPKSRRIDRLKALGDIERERQTNHPTQNFQATQLATGARNLSVENFLNCNIYVLFCEPLCALICIVNRTLDCAFASRRWVDKKICVRRKTHHTPSKTARSSKNTSQQISSKRKFAWNMFFRASHRCIVNLNNFECGGVGFGVSNSKRKLEFGKNEIAKGAIFQLFNLYNSNLEERKSYLCFHGCPSRSAAGVMQLARCAVDSMCRHSGTCRCMLQRLLWVSFCAALLSLHTSNSGSSLPVCALFLACSHKSWSVSSRHCVFVCLPSS